VKTTNKKAKVKPVPRRRTVKPTDDTTQTMIDNTTRLLQNSGQLSRAMLGNRLGRSFDGDRDLYKTFGYIRSPVYDDYRAFYDRMGLATRMVEKFSDDTWNKPPTLIDGEARSDMDEQQLTPFLSDWNALVKRLGVWQMMRQADVMCGIGRYSILFLGTTGAYDSPAGGSRQLFYLAAYDEKQAEIQKLVTDQKSEKYGMPEEYRVSMDDPKTIGSVITRDVHYSRCIHVSENRLGSRVYGRPRLQEVLNRLMDLEKVTGGGAEAAWLAVFMGLLLSSKEGMQMPEPGTPENTALHETMEAFVHRMQRYAVIEGVDVNNLGVSTVDISGIYQTLASDLTGSKGIPQRIFFGSERGELASSQDMQEWNGFIGSRRVNFAEPEILEPFVNWCILHGVVTPPESTKFKIVWQPVYTMTQMEEANYALALAQGASAVTGGVPEQAMTVNEFRSVVHFPAFEDIEQSAIKKEEKVEKGLIDGQPVNGKASEKDLEETEPEVV